MDRIYTDRLILEEFKIADAADVSRIANDKKVSDTLQNMPYPYSVENAESWIVDINQKNDDGLAEIYAIRLRSDGRLIGSVNLGIMRTNNNATIGYWLGNDFWGQGYGFEAAKALVDRAFNDLGMHKIYGTYMAENKASGNIMRKLGMKREGYFKDHIYKNGKYIDEEQRSVLKDDYLSNSHN